VGLDSTRHFKHNHVTAMIEGHLRLLRQSPRYRNSHIYVFPEANFG
jgi:hypothetical protein